MSILPPYTINYINVGISFEKKRNKGIKRKGIMGKSNGNQ